MPVVDGCRSEAFPSDHNWRLAAREIAGGDGRQHVWVDPYRPVPGLDLDPRAARADSRAIAIGREVARVRDDVEGRLDHVPVGDRMDCSWRCPHRGAGRRRPTPMASTLSYRESPSGRGATRSRSGCFHTRMRPAGRASYACEMRPLRYSINVTLDGCCDHRAIPADEDLHRHAAESLNQADALLFGRVTYDMMQSAWRPPAATGARPDWMEPFAQTINAAKKHVVSSTLERVDWNAELVRGDLGNAVRSLKQDPGKGLLVGGVKLPMALTELGVDRRVRVRGAPQARGPRSDAVRRGCRSMSTCSS